MKGTAATLGLIRIRDLAYEIQAYGSVNEHPDDDKPAWDICQAMEDARTSAIEKLAIFFRATPEEILKWSR